MESANTTRRELFVPNPKARLREQVHEVMRFHHYSSRTEETYWQWIVRYLRFYRRAPPCPQYERRMKRLSHHQ